MIILRTSANSSINAFDELENNKERTKGTALKRLQHHPTVVGQCCTVWNELAKRIQLFDATLVDSRD